MKPENCTYNAYYPDRDTTHVKITNNKHPYYGQVFQFVREIVQESAVVIRLPCGTAVSVPAAWTDYVIRLERPKLTASQPLLEKNGLAEVLMLLSEFRTDEAEPNKSRKSLNGKSVNKSRTDDL